MTSRLPVAGLLGALLLTLGTDAALAAEEPSADPLARFDALAAVKRDPEADAAISGAVAAAARGAAGQPSADLAERLFVQGRFLLDTGRPAAAEAAFARQRVQLMRLHGPSDLRVSTAAAHLAEAAAAAGRADAARAALDQSMAIRVAALGPDHGLVGYAWRDRGDVAQRLGRPEEAVQAYLAALAVFERVIGLPDGALSRRSPGHRSLDGFAMRGERHFNADATLAGLKSGFDGLPPAAFHAPAPVLGHLADSLADIAARSGDPGAARAAASAARLSHALVADFYGDGHPAVAKALETLGSVLLRTGAVREGVAALRAAAAIVTAVHGPTSPAAGRILRGLGRALLDAGHHAEAATAARQALAIEVDRSAIRRRVEPDDAPLDLAFAVLEAAAETTVASGAGLAEGLLAIQLTALPRRDPAYPAAADSPRATAVDSLLRTEAALVTASAKPVAAWNRSALDDLRARAEAERSALRRVPPLPGLDDLQAALGPNEAAAALVIAPYRPWIPGDRDRLAAGRVTVSSLVVTPGGARLRGVGVHSAVLEMFGTDGTSGGGASPDRRPISELIIGDGVQEIYAAALREIAAELAGTQTLYLMTRHDGFRRDGGAGGTGDAAGMAARLAARPLPGIATVRPIATLRAVLDDR